MKDSTLSCIGCTFWLVVLLLFILIGFRPSMINRSILPSQNEIAEYLQFNSTFRCPENAICKGHNVTCLPGFDRNGPIDDAALHLIKAAAFIRKEKIGTFYPVYTCKKDSSIARKVDKKILKELDEMKKYFTLMTVFPKSDEVHEYCKPVSQFIDKLGVSKNLTNLVKEELKAFTTGKLVCVNETTNIGIFSPDFLHSPKRLLVSFIASCISVIVVILIWTSFARYNIVNNHIIPYIYGVLEQNSEAVPVVFIRDGAREAFSYNFSQKNIDKAFKSSIEKLRKDSRYSFTFERFEGVPRETIKQTNILSSQ